MINVPLLEAALQEVIDHPELHYQRAFHKQTECGTAHCFGGWALALEGAELVENALDFPFLGVRKPDGSIGNSWNMARDALGLTEEQALRLFASENTRAMLELMVKDLVNTGDLYDPEHYRDLVS